MSEKPDRESKTEDATEKRLSDARDKGQLPFSREVPMLLSSVVICIAIAFLAARASSDIGIALRPLWEFPGGWRMSSSEDASALMLHITIAALLPLVPMLALICVAGVLGALVQSRGFATERVRPQASRISPLAGWSRLFGKEGLAHAIKSTLGILFVGAASYLVLLGLLNYSIALSGVDPGTLTVALADSASQLLCVMIATMGAVAALDVVLTRVKWRHDLRMTKQEVKDESKDIDGDPQVKFRMRMIARRRLRKRVIANVPRATVVITNPTHFAVALRYVAGETPAPIVVAKGTDLIALKIREVAADASIPVVEDPPLARALYSGAEVDAAIPPELYRAVARIILFVDKAAVRAGART